MNSRILIVDDDSAIRESMRDFLENSLYTVVSASSGEEALDYLAKNTIDVVITDIMMPGINGLELTDTIKKTYDDIDVMVMTGYSSDHSYEEAINKGASEFVFKPIRFEELLLRLKRLLKERQLTVERYQMLEKLKKLAITDGLTKLFNSRHFYNQLDLEVERCNRYNHSFSLLLFDIDNFKEYNDTYGHLAGDKVLIRLGQIIRTCLRNMDSAYRYGGEEFTILLPETNLNEAGIVGERIRSKVESEKFVSNAGESVTITISVGVTGYRLGEAVSELVQRADQAMYASKEKGRNLVTYIVAKSDGKNKKKDN